MRAATAPGRDRPGAARLKTGFRSRSFRETSGGPVARAGRATAPPVNLEPIQAGGSKWSEEKPTAPSKEGVVAGFSVHSQLGPSTSAVTTLPPNVLDASGANTVTWSHT
ncbi:hypothetical protein V5799_033863, partial [Amblyomma americanum]